MWLLWHNDVDTNLSFDSRVSMLLQNVVGYVVYGKTKTNSRVHFYKTNFISKTVIASEGSVFKK